MGKAGETLTVSVDAGARSAGPVPGGLRLTVERLLQQSEGRPVRIATLTREPSPFASLFPAEVLSLTLQSGDKRSLFVKYLGSEQADHPDKQCRDREIRIYEELLAGGGAQRGAGPRGLRVSDLPVVKYYGSSWNATTKRREVFLEYIDDWNLRYHDLEHWFTAARQLARLHAYFANRAEQLLACEFLLRFDADYLCEWADRALGTVGEYSTDLAAVLARVVGGYDRVSEVLAQQPPTLVHNDLSPKNVLAHQASSPARICFVDWEMAGVGCGVLDLVVLKHGLDPVNDQKMCAAYCQELAGTGLLPTRPQEISSLFAAGELHKTVYRLAHSKAWGLPIDTVARWVMEAQQLLGQL